MTLYAALADLPLVIESHSRATHERATSSGFDRTTTTFALHGDGHTGQGEDVTYETVDHERLLEHDIDLAGEYTFEEFSGLLDDVALFPPAEPPEREYFRDYRRWAVESAGLDLALRQAGTDLASALDRSYDPVRFVVSTRLTPVDADGDPDGAGSEPTTDRLHDILAAYPGTEFKLDPTTDWTDAVLEDLVELDRVRILDMKGQYHDTPVDQDPDPRLYRAVVERFDCVVEDPATDPAVDDLVRQAAGRVSWDAPIHSLDDVRDRPFEPRWLNVKPSRFGTVESLLECVEWALDNDVQLYGGGQFELDVGRGQIQALASLFYPDGPNDVAPGGYNDPAVPAGLPPSPLAPPDDPAGFRW